MGRKYKANNSIRVMIKVADLIAPVLHMMDYEGNKLLLNHDEFGKQKSASKHRFNNIANGIKEK